MLFLVFLSMSFYNNYDSDEDLGRKLLVDLIGSGV